MAGIISAAMMVALKDQGLENSFDEIYSVSAGAVNAAYFLSGYGWYGLSIYYDDLISKKFFDWRRAFRGESIISLDYVTDVVMEKLKPLDTETVISSAIKLHVAASSVDEIKLRDFSSFDSAEQLKTVIKATACLPIIGGPPVTIDGERFLDGGILLPHPFAEARSAGVSHIVALNTGTSAVSHKRPTAVQWLTANRLDHLLPGLGERYIERLKSYGALRLEMQELDSQRTGPPFVLDVTCPAGSHQVPMLTRARGVLFEGIRAGYGTMVNSLSSKPQKAFLRPTVVDES